MKKDLIITPIIILIFIISFYTLFQGQGNIIGAVTSKPNIINEEFKITYYYTPFEGDFAEWTTTNDETISGINVCQIGYKGFYEEVKCQGNGVTKEGLICSYDTIKPTKEDSLKLCKDPTKGEIGSRGSTAIGTNPTAHKTIAVDPDVIPLRSLVYIDFGPGFEEWTGCYTAEDVGSAIKGNHIDLYVGVGKTSLEVVKNLPDKAKVTLGCEEEIREKIEEKKEEIKAYEAKVLKTIGTYSIKPSFSINLDYNLLDEYEKLKSISQNLISICSSSADIDQCIQDNNKLFSNNNFELLDCGKIISNIKKICAKSNKEIYVYSEEDGETKKRNPTYKFALYFEDMPPPPIESLDIIPNPVGESSVILKWKKSPALDVKNYNIYYSKTEFINKKIENSQIVDTDKKEITNKYTSLKSIDLTKEPQCTLNNNICTFYYSATPDNIELKPETLYYSEQDDSLIYLLSNLENNIEYNFAVSAVDQNNNEINNIDKNQKLTLNKNYKKATSKDNLAPGIVEFKFGANKIIIIEPTINIDGSDLKDIISYKIYTSENYFDNIADADLLTTSTTTEKTIALTPDNYYAVTAIDQNNNEFKQVTPKQYTLS